MPRAGDGEEAAGSEIERLRALLARETIARQDVERSLNTFQHVLGLAPNAMVLVDRQFTLTYVNATFLALHQVPEAAVVGQTLEAVIGGEHFALARPQLEAVFAGETIEFSTWYTYPDRERFMHVYYYPIRTNGSVDLAGVILTDITPQAQTEAALRDSEERYHALSEATTEGIVIHDQGIILEVNHALADHLGYTVDELRGRSVLLFTAPESREEMIRRMQQGEPGPYIATSLHRDGSRTIGEIRARHFIYRGRPVRLVAMRDITELVQAREVQARLLHDTESWAAEMDAIISSIADMIIVVDMDGHIRRMNAAADALSATVGVSPPHDLTEMLSRFSVNTPDGQEIRLDNPELFRVFHGETVQGVVIVVQLPAGRALWLSASAGPIRLTDGRQIGAVFTTTDITDLHALQEEMEVYLHTVSHDLRAPLAVISGHAQLMRAQFEEEHREDELLINVDAILRSVQRMNTMIQDLVDAARLQGGQLTLKLQPIDLATYLRDWLLRIETVMPVARIHLELPTDLPPVLADYDRLERIFTNLVSNALKYSPEDAPVIIWARQQATLVDISVQDFGVGIAETDQPHLFDRFYRGTQESRVEGIGLGLYITRMLVEAHHGTIAVESLAGQGSIFMFTLPVA